MKAINFLKQKLSDEEVNEFLNEIMGFKSKVEPNIREHRFTIYDEDGDILDYTPLIGYKDLSIVENILLLKEKIDEQRGFRNGKSQLQNELKRLLSL